MRKFFKSKLGYFLLTTIVTGALSWVKLKNPGLDLPSASSIVGLGAGLIAGHAATDITALITGSSVRAKEKAE